jgi:hypothetical protein
MGHPAADETARLLGNETRGDREALELTEDAAAAELRRHAADARQAHYLFRETGEIHHARLGERKSDGPAAACGRGDMAELRERLREEGAARR